MYKRKASTFIIKSISALSRVILLRTPSQSLFSCSLLPTLHPLHQSPKAPPLIQQCQLFSSSAQRNDYWPDSSVSQGITNEPYPVPLWSSPPPTHQDSSGCHRGDVAGVRQDNSDGFYSQYRNGVPSEKNQPLRPDEHQWSNVGGGHGGVPNGYKQMNGSGFGNGITGNFYHGSNERYSRNPAKVNQINAVPNGSYPYTQMNGSGIGNEVTGNIYQGSKEQNRSNPAKFNQINVVPNGSYPYTQMNGSGISNEVTGNFYQGSNEPNSCNPAKVNQINAVPNGSYPYTQMNGSGISNEVAGNFYQRYNEQYGGNPAKVNQINVHPNGSYHYTQMNGSGIGNEVTGNSYQGSNEQYSGNYMGTIEELDGLCRDGKVKEAVEVLALLDSKGIMLDIPRYFVLMQACDDDKFLEQARKVYNYILKQFVNVEVRVNNKILDMFFKCGSAADAYQLFDSMPQRNLTSWDTMIAGLTNSGFGEEALDVFTEFKQKGLKPDGGLFVSVFSACGSLGAVDEGLLHFKSMKDDFGIAPGMEHYIAIVDMFGRTGYLDEALEFIGQMPVEPSIDIWETLMTLSRLNGNFELGDRCAEIVDCLDPCRLNEESKKGLLHVKASDLAKENERKKASEIKRVHEYRAGDTSHPENDRIYAQLRCLTQQMKEAGYVSDLRFVLHDVDHESKEEALLAHSERLALSYGLMTTRARSDIRIMKNLRVCGDCHNALKIISKIVGRQIIARDAKRFHHFGNGVCSCNDYW